MWPLSLAQPENEATTVRADGQKEPGGVTEWQILNPPSYSMKKIQEGQALYAVALFLSEGFSSAEKTVTSLLLLFLLVCCHAVKLVLELLTFLPLPYGC